MIVEASLFSNTIMKTWLKVGRLIGVSPAPGVSVGGVDGRPGCLAQAVGVSVKIDNANRLAAI
jgi:hypothetical protein